MKRVLQLFIVVFAVCSCVHGQSVKPLTQLQQDFVDLRFGMFIHFNMGTYCGEDWADPEAPPALFNPVKLDCNQWAAAAKEAKMTYGCLTTRHHSGFCIWDTKTTNYNVMNGNFKRDVVKEYAEAFRKQGLKVMLYYSILDVHHKLMPGSITPQHTKMVKEQLTELLTNYGEISALIIDGWDAPWSRISYEEVPFSEIYYFVKKLQPNCLVMDLNAAKYPADVLFYGDIKSYEQNAGQNISKESNKLPALSCLPLNNTWFWKDYFPTTPVRTPESIINDNIVPLNKVYCNFILNVSPNRDGLIDDNAVAALREIGRLWNNSGPLAKLSKYDAPIVASNMAKRKPIYSSWSNDSYIADLANDDNFSSPWLSNATVKDPWIIVELGKTAQPFNAVVIAEGNNKSNVKKYTIEYFANNTWTKLLTGNNEGYIKVERFDQVTGSKIRIRFDQFDAPPAISEVCVYNEKR